MEKKLQGPHSREHVIYDKMPMSASDQSTWHYKVIYWHCCWIVGKATVPDASILYRHKFTSHIPIQLLASGLGKAGKCNSSVWSPAIHMRNSEEAPGCRLQPCPEPAIVAIGGVNQWIDLSSSPFFLFSS